MDLLRDLDWVQRLAFRLCSDRAIAEDLRQEAALAVLRQGAPEQDRRRPWLAGIVRNKLRMKRRTDGRREAREAGVADLESVSVDVDVVERAETQRAVTDAVLRLREPYRTTVLQRYFEEWTPGEIAERTGTSVETVKSRLKRGLRALEDDLANVFADAGAGSRDEAGTGWFSALLPLAVVESKRRALASATGGAQGLAAASLTTTGPLLMFAKSFPVPVVLLALFGLYSLTRAPKNGDLSTGVVEPRTGQTTVDRAHDLPSATEPGRLGRSALQAPGDEATSLGDAAQPMCALSGYVMDDRGRSLDGVDVALFRPADELVATAQTGPEGRFSLSVPEQSDPLLELRIEGEWFHRSERLEFGGTGWRARLPLTSGPRDVGTVVLTAAGAVAGRVFDASGAPVAGASVTTWGGDTTTSAEDGSFRLDRVSLGPDALEVRAEGFPIAEADITLRASSVTAGVEVRLEPEASLRGQAVDRLGQPVAGARVELDPVDEDDISRAVSGPDGQFELPFLWLEGAHLRVDAEGFDLWDSEEWDQEFEPGAGAIRVELNPAASVEFSVVDDATGQPIERFGLAVHKGAGSEGMQPVGDTEPPLQDYPGGRAVAGAREEYDEVVVCAEGYERFQDDVLTVGISGESLRSQTVRLRPFQAQPPVGSITGRVLRDGAPLANAFVELEGGKWMTERMKRLTDQSGDVFMSTGSSLPLVRTSADGSFTAEGLERPLYRIRVHALGGAATELPLVELAEGETVDLGDVHCRPGGTVRGGLIPPPGVSPKGLVASIGHGLGRVRSPLDDGGNFELLHVPAGNHSIDIEVRDGDFEDGAEAEVVVTAGAVTNVRIDASGGAGIRVRLVLDLDGAPADGCRVVFVDADSPQTVVAMAHCDASGRVDTYLPAAGDVAVCLMETFGDLIRHPEARLGPSAGTDIQESLGFRFGSAQVVVPGGRTLPADGGLAVQLFDTSGVLHQRITLEIVDGEVVDSPDVTYSPARGTGGGFALDLHRVLEGAWTVDVRVVALDFEGDLEPSKARAQVWLEGQSITVL
ncbi:sigma-70 family RNA polymerase sigma factor [Engelhardtia mirabilis]|uniref:sigma-70 family RNA polymerase sigma factor n=1 Tax=Engelhardtia mirabilis TaxID=2528011 RepID=UPI003AF3F670